MPDHGSRRITVVWRCVGEGYAGYGETPYDAYIGWLEDVINGESI